MTGELTRARRLVGAVLVVSACTFGALGGGDDAADDSASEDDGASEGANGSSGSDGADGTSAMGSGGGEGEGDDASPGPGNPCEDGGGCDPNASCDPTTGAAVCTCDEGWFGDGMSCESVNLPVLRVQLPCSPGCGPGICTVPTDDHAAANLAGDPDTIYDVMLRIRGVVELKSYDGPGQDGYWHPAATPADNGWNTFGISVLDPDVTYWLNSGEEGFRCYGLDETHVVPMRGGTTVTLHTENGGDTCGIENADGSGVPIVIPDVPPAPMPYDGQFVQVDVISIVPH